jgi:hypothetical protein
LLAYLKIQILHSFWIFAHSAHQSLLKHFLHFVKSTKAKTFRIADQT